MAAHMDPSLDLETAEAKRIETANGHMNKCWQVKFGREGSLCSVKMNPIVSIVSAIVVWAFIISIAVEPDHMNRAFMVAKLWVCDVWSWFYIISQDIWVVVLLYLAFRYGHLKIGRDDEKPRFSDVTWFSLLFTCGVAVGMFYYVAEPMWHYKGWGGARFINSANGYSHPSEDAVHGMMVTWYHWGLHGWIPYTTVGALLGLLAYRRGFPLSVRFGLYPLIGDKVYGWIGDCVDILSIVTTIAGVCTSLGLGTMSINMGLQRLSLGFYRGTSYNVPDEPKYEHPTCAGTGNKYWAYVKECDEKWSDSSGTWQKQYDREAFGVQANLDVQIVIICVVTCLATLSVISGLNRGIKDLSRLAFALSALLLLYVMFAGDTWFQLNLTVQTFGYYIWYLPKIAFHTDAFELLNKASYGRGGFDTQGSDTWMNDWTIFYWGWWISWAPFVGTFLAQISRGRTLRQFVVATLIIPSLYCFVWFGCVGGEAVKQQTLAEGSGLCGVGWLNGGGKTSPGSKHCRLSEEEMDPATGKCKDAAQLKTDGVIAPGDEANCGRAACSDATLKKGRCGKLLPTCDHYAASYSTKQKELLKIGYNPPCVLMSNGAQHPMLSGKCQRFAWEHWEQKMDQCVKITTWVDVPCGGGKDPTALDASKLGCGVGPNAPNSDWCQDKCKDVITKEMVDLDNPNRMYNHFSKGGVASAAAEHIISNFDAEHGPTPQMDMKKVWIPDSNGVPRYEPPSCFVPAPDTQICMWNQLTEDVLFDLIGTLAHSQGFSDFLSVVSLIALVIYFITSSDSGSLVVDIMAANGEEEPPVPQRVFWALTEGACAIALLYSGKNVLGPYGDPGQGGLRALQAASIVMGLPYTFMLFWFSQALVQVCREEVGELDPERPRFKMFLLSIPRSEIVSAGQGGVILLRNAFFPGISPAVKEATKSWPLGTLSGGWAWAVALQLLYFATIACVIASTAEFNVIMMGASIYCGFAAFVSLVRREIRRLWGIPRGDFLTDLMWSVVVPAFVLTQLEIQMKEEKNEPVVKKVEPVVKPDEQPASVVKLDEQPANAAESNAPVREPPAAVEQPVEEPAQTEVSEKMTHRPSKVMAI
eukprot:TRINITY_DN3114_c0_g1_i1.p1 TRINITY_DN3114_c0_g1~~TRINITY_DN3114_c0_g1_i1.p1  ORF type:complete len:1095 (-),score=177.76 TRINITY_DN3114_c0_g1_i1:403-3687(-)